uniref:Col_cuticle_N domain-containing protein n=1 Tax=Rhabditophanes sp. KR3021 TaxID=114890 RepID=A0AC35UGW6_9BILA
MQYTFLASITVIAFHLFSIKYFVDKVNVIAKFSKSELKVFLNLENVLTIQFKEAKKERFIRSTTPKCKCDGHNKCAAGPQGPNGVDGENGYPGLHGSRGQVGLTAKIPKASKINDNECRICPFGPKGMQGSQGATGEAGRVGLPGDEGKAGHDGAPGRPGLQGNIGSPGIVGKVGELTFDSHYFISGSSLKGVAGSGSIRYLKGSRGSKGLPGPPGAKGPTGYEGRSGFRGSPGFIGKQGLRGDKGLQGPVGHTGPTGLQGIPGKELFPYCPCARKYSDERNEFHVNKSKRKTTYQKENIAVPKLLFIEKDIEPITEHRKKYEVPILKPITQ